MREKKKSSLGTAKSVGLGLAAGAVTLVGVASMAQIANAEEIVSVNSNQDAEAQEQTVDVSPLQAAQNEVDETSRAKDQAQKVADEAAAQQKAAEETQAKAQAEAEAKAQAEQQAAQNQAEKEAAQKAAAEKADQETVEKALADAQAQAEQAQKDADAKAQEEVDAQKSKDQAQADSDSANQAQENAATEKGDAQTGVNNAQGEADAADKNVSDKEGEKAAAQDHSKVEEAQKDASYARKNAGDAKDQANADQKVSDAAAAAVEESQQKVNAAQKALDAAAGVSNADKTSNGYFEQKGTADAQKAQEAYVNTQWNTWLKDHPDWLGMNDPNSAVSADNMKRSLEGLAYLNGIRTKEGLSQVGISDFLMALAQTHGQFSTNLLETTGEFNHEQVWEQSNNTGGGLFTVGENLTVGQTTWAEAYNAWYDKEKAVYNDYLAQGLTPSQIENDHYMEVGHYLTIINPDMKAVGFATNGGMWVLEYDLTSPTVDGATYIADFDAWYNKIKNLPSVDDARKALDAAKTALAKAQSDASVKAATASKSATAATVAQQKADEAQKAYEAAQKAFADGWTDADEANLTALKQTADEKAQALSDAQVTLQKAEQKLADATVKKASATEALADAKIAHDTAVLALNQAQNTLAAAQKRVEGIEDGTIDPVKEAHDALEEANAALAQSQKEHQDAVVAQQTAQSALESATEVTADATAAAQQANERLEVASRAYAVALAQLNALMPHDQQANGGAAESGENSIEMTSSGQGYTEKQPAGGSSEQDRRLASTGVNALAIAEVGMLLLAAGAGLKKYGKSAV